MNTAPATSEATVTNLPEKLIDYLVRTSTEGNETPEEIYRNLIEKTWAEATRKSKKDKLADKLFKESTVINSELKERISFALEVIHNTLRKLTYSIPEELSTLPRSSSYKVEGIFYYDAVRRVEVPLSSKGADDFNVPQNAYVKISNVHAWDKSKGKEHKFPLEYLNRDPIFLSQMVRNRVKVHMQQQRRVELADLGNKIADTRSTIKQAEKNLEVLIERIETLESSPVLKVRTPRPPKPDNI
jgi:uncharacterized coiled-coil protein SlyX